jgi:hypothetical protein
LKELVTADKDQWVLKSLAEVITKVNQTFTATDIVMIVEKLTLKG